MDNLTQFMKIAIDEATVSLREGNHGFGAVIARNNEVIAQSHDREESDGDPTSRAETNAIKLASKIIGKNLHGCTLLSTHEPCPMCAAAIIWAGIGHIAYGYPIDESITQGRKRIAPTCEEPFRRADIHVRIDKNIAYDQCQVLYRRDVRGEIKRLAPIVRMRELFSTLKTFVQRWRHVKY